MISIFMTGKDHNVRVKTIEIIKLFLSQFKTYFKQF